MNKYDKINGHDVADLTNSPHQMTPEPNDKWDSVDIIRKKYTALRDKKIKNDFTKGVIRGLWLALSVLGEADFLEDNYEE